MPLVIHAESHCDHVTPAVVEFVKQRFANRDGFFIETVELPAELGTLECGLYGPLCGDAPVAEREVHFGRRPGREHDSRLVARRARRTNKLSVITGPHAGLPCVLYTVYGGPVSPKEVNDPTLADHDREESAAFWSEHALAG
ncbi:MAG TPA: hypothetical protein VMV69_23985 [Pirellulales bacterium]|nr:hypothetical protein [Pirellulales bacterium]